MLLAIQQDCFIRNADCDGYALQSTLLAPVINTTRIVYGLGVEDGDKRGTYMHEMVWLVELSRVVNYHGFAAFTWIDCLFLISLIVRPVGSAGDRLFRAVQVSVGDDLGFLWSNICIKRFFTRFVAKAGQSG
jgi:hypothetical protein